MSGLRDTDREVLAQAFMQATAYLEGVERRPVAPTKQALEGLQAFDETLPESGSEPGKTLRLLDSVGSPATMAMAGPRFFGLVMGGSLPVSLAANWLAGAWDQNTVAYRIAPATAHIQSVTLRWLQQLFGLPSGCGGAFVTGATMATFCGLAAARNSVLRKAGWNVEADGLFGAPPISVVVGAEIHSSVTKALGMLGLGRTRTTVVPVDRQGRMRPELLPTLSGPSIVCVQAGNVNSGAFDPVEEICRRVRPAGAWVHCDGAFGLWALAAPSRAPLARGIEVADSWATDAHKWLNVPYDCGVAFVREAGALKAAMAMSAHYLPFEESQRNPADYAPELSQRARGVEVWAALRTLGRQGIAELIERNCAQATRFARGLSEAGFSILNEVVLNQVLVSFGSPEKTNRVIQEVQNEGTCWCGGTVWQGTTAMRISVSCWATRDLDVERSLEAIIRAAARVAQNG
jgi:glutamate/tyrosine decarboxylase-like PLP-dependent enzyme